MDIRRLTDAYAVSPQIDPEDVAVARDAGFVALICNRPDAEVPPSHQADSIRAAAEEAGLAFHDLPVVHGALTPELVEAHRQAVEDADGPVLAYCASGNRSTVIWALGAAPRTAPDALLAAARAHGYQLEMLRPQLEALHRG